MVQRLFSPDLDRAIASEYMSGATFTELADKYGGTACSVRNAALRGGATYNAKRKADRKLVDRDPDTVAEAVRLYREEGWSVPRLAKRYHCRTNVVSAALAEASVVLHPGGRYHPFFRTDEDCLRVALEYEDGASLRALATKYGCTITAVKRAIGRGGGSTRPGGREEFWTPERVRYLIEQYRSGRSQESLGKEFNVNQATISARLRMAGATTPPPRPRGEDHHSYRGGAAFAPGGYISVLVYEDDLKFCVPNSSGRVLEHRLVMGRAIGRPLTKDETVHHINGDKTDNRPENLQLRQGRHGVGVVMTCRSCGSYDVESVEIASEIAS